MRGSPAPPPAASRRFTPKPFAAWVFHNLKAASHVRNAAFLVVLSGVGSHTPVTLPRLRRSPRYADAAPGFRPQASWRNVSPMSPPRQTDRRWISRGA